MKFKNVLLLIVLMVIIGGGLGFLLFRGEKEEISDALRFKNEYERLNGTINESDGQRYNDVMIATNNPIKYVNCEEAYNLLNGQKAVVYIGSSSSPLSRGVLPVLLDVANEYQVGVIYYLDLDDEESIYEVKEGRLEQTRLGTSSYYKLLEFLSAYLDDYILSENDREYVTGEKRISSPTILTVLDGKLDYYIGSVTLNEDQSEYDNLTEKQHDELYKQYDKMFNRLYKVNSCSNNHCD